MYELDIHQATGRSLAALTVAHDQLSLVVLDLTDANWQKASDIAASLSQWRNRNPRSLIVGVASNVLPTSAGPALAVLDLTIGDGPSPWCAGKASDLEEVLRTATTSPQTTEVLSQILRAGDIGTSAGLFRESLAYSMLLAGPEFAHWRNTTTRRALPPVQDQPVLLERAGPRLTITLNRPDRHNAWGREVRDAFVAALELPDLDSSVTRVSVKGAGPSFCSGGDLDEFGTAADVVSAHLIRVRSSGGAAVDRLAERLGPAFSFDLHGACIGAGLEIPAFAQLVRAYSDARFRLPEVSMGLIPGAGGTVSIPRRIGRWRTAWMALTGANIEVKTALEWGLVDELI